MVGLGRSRRSRKVMDGLFPSLDWHYKWEKLSVGWGGVACRIIVSAPVPVPFLWIWDFNLGPWFGTWIWDWTWQFQPIKCRGSHTLIQSELCGSWSYNPNTAHTSTNSIWFMEWHYCSLKELINTAIFIQIGHLKRRHVNHFFKI